MAKLSAAFITITQELWNGSSTKEVMDTLQVAGMLSGDKTEIQTAFNDAIKINAWNIVGLLLNLELIQPTLSQIKCIIEEKPELLKGLRYLIPNLNSEQIAYICPIKDVCKEFASGNIGPFKNTPAFLSLLSHKEMFPYYPNIFSQWDTCVWRADREELLKSIVANYAKPESQQVQFHNKVLTEFATALPKELVFQLINRRHLVLDVFDIASSPKNKLVDFLTEAEILSDTFMNGLMQQAYGTQKHITSVLELSPVPLTVADRLTLRNTPVCYNLGFAELALGICLEKADLETRKLLYSTFITKVKALKFKDILVSDVLGSSSQVFKDYLLEIILEIARNEPKQLTQENFLCNYVIAAWQHFATLDKLNKVLELAMLISPDGRLKTRLGFNSLLKEQFDLLGVKPAYCSLDIAIRENSAAGITYLYPIIKPANPDNYIFNAIKGKSFDALKALEPFIPSEKLPKFKELVGLVCALDLLQA
jgi:hypothetical protein